MERWLPVVGYEGLYEVSARGQVRSLDRTIRQGALGYLRNYPGRLLAQACNGGYWKVTLSREGRARFVCVHRLVLEAFDGPCPPGQQALHGPAGRLVNYWPENLRWGTPTENQRDRRRDGTMLLGDRHPTAKLTEAAVRELRARYAAGGVVHRELAAEYGVAEPTIAKVIARRSWRHVT